MLTFVATERLSPDTAPTPRGKYSQVSLTSGPHRLAFLSGQTGRRTDGSISGDPQQQAVDAFRNIAALLDAVGSGPRLITHLRTYLVGRDALSPFAAARTSVFDTWFGDDAPPSNTLSIVAGLADIEAVVEIEAVAEAPPLASTDAFDNLPDVK